MNNMKRKHSMMMIGSLLITTLTGLAGPGDPGAGVKKTPAVYVNPFIGASTSIHKAGAAHGLGKTFPGATTPFGMVQLSPNTITGGDNGSGFLSPIVINQGLGLPHPKSGGRAGC